MTFGSVFGRTFSPTFQPSSQAAAAGGWWLSGGIAAADCVAAYNAKGVADIDTSKINLNNPGTYNLTTTAAPDWDATNGWKFTASAKKHLLVPISMSGLGGNDQNWSAIVKFSNFTTNGASSSFFGYYNNYDGGANASLEAECYLADTGYVRNGGSRGIGAPGSSGTVSLRGNTAYVNKTNKGTISTSTGTFTNSGLGIGCRIIYNVGYSQWANVYIQQFALYRSVITETQHHLVVDAINAL